MIVLFFFLYSSWHVHFQITYCSCSGVVWCSVFTVRCIKDLIVLKTWKFSLNFYRHFMLYYMYILRELICFHTNPAGNHLLACIWTLKVRHVASLLWELDHNKTNLNVNRNHVYYNLQRSLTLCKALSQCHQNHQAFHGFFWGEGAYDIKFEKQNETTQWKGTKLPFLDSTNLYKNVELEI